MQLFVLPVSKVGFEPAQNGLLYFFLEGILMCPPPKKTTNLSLNALSY